MASDFVYDVNDEHQNALPPTKEKKGKEYIYRFREDSPDDELPTYICLYDISPAENPEFLIEIENRFVGEIAEKCT